MKEGEKKRIFCFKRNDEKKLKIVHHHDDGNGVCSYPNKISLLNVFYVLRFDSAAAAAVAAAADAAAVVSVASVLALSHSRACERNETNRCEQHPPISFSILLVSPDWFCVHNQWQTCWVGIRFVYNTSISARMRRTADLSVWVQQTITSRYLWASLVFPSLGATRRTKCVCEWIQSTGLFRSAWISLVFFDSMPSTPEWCWENRSDVFNLNSRKYGEHVASWKKSNQFR